MHKMENGGLAAVNVFRKHLAPGAKQSRWQSQVLRAEDVAERDGLIIAKKQAEV